MPILETLTVIRAPLERCFDLARSVEVHLAGNVHWGEPAVAVAGVSSGLLAHHHRVTWRARHFAFRHRLTSEITAFDRPAYFQDRMVHGIFRYMRHDHYFRAVSPTETQMRDVFAFGAPVPFLAGYMRKLLEERNAAIKSIAESGEWRRYLP